MRWLFLLLLAGCMAQPVKEKPEFYVGAVLLCGYPVWFTPVPPGISYNDMIDGGWKPIDIPESLIEHLWDVDQLFQKVLDPKDYPDILCMDDLRSL